MEKAAIDFYERKMLVTGGGEIPWDYLTMVVDRIHPELGEMRVLKDKWRMTSLQQKKFIEKLLEQPK